MRLAAHVLRLSATDLSNHVACRHLTSLDLAAAEGRLEPPAWRRPEALLLAERGLEHENAYLAFLAGQGLRVTRLAPDADVDRAFEATVAAMRAGDPVIAQATLIGGRWVGRADVLLRVERASALGAWSYQAADTKLARETRGGTILQLSLYSEIVEAIQGLAPESMHVVPPRPGFVLESHRVRDYAAYFRRVKSRLEATVDRLSGDGGEAAGTYPEPVPHCDVCRWWPACDRKRHADDHLSLVAGITRLQTRELESRAVASLGALAELPVPIAWSPKRGTRAGYERSAHQARVQDAGRRMRAPIHELLPPEPGRGLTLLPVPSPGDLFLDIEGDPYVEGGGLEYLFGLASLDDRGETRYEARWALGPAAERRAFEETVDAIVSRWREAPGLHVYHFAPYEPAALKRLMGRHATREGEIDALLRGGRFVDLHAVVRQSLRASVERYSIKDLEPFFGFERGQPLEGARAALRSAEAALERSRPDLLSGGQRGTIEAYNRDDCLAALALRDWLETLRSELEDGGRMLPRPESAAGAPSEALEERTRRVAELMGRLTAGMPEDPPQRSAEDRARWLLAQLLDWHRREEKAAWWEYFRLRVMPDDELLDERDALAGLAFEGEAGLVKRSMVHRYSFPRQETSVREGEKLHAGLMDDFGEVVAIDLVRRTVDIKKTKKAIELHPASVFRNTVVPGQVMAESLFRLGEWVAGHGVDGVGSYRAARDLLLVRPPRIPDGGPLERAHEDPVDAACRLALALDRGVLPIQGPPGSGKTYAGARMIAALLRAGKKVGVCAGSHKVIRNLLDEAVRRAAEQDVAIACVHKVSETGEHADSEVVEVEKNEEALAALSSGQANVVGGTAWLWSREDFFEQVDVLFVDEAGQMSLANALAVAPAAASLVLLGDPRQLDQPQQGSHPEGAGVSALDHLLAGEATMPKQRGLFLPETWRLHPKLCALTSELFYEGRLASRPGRERQALCEPGRFAGAGLWFLPVEHDGNQNASAEEVEAVARLVDELLRDSARWIDHDGVERPLALEDVLIVAPYNAQVADLATRLPGARVGTVDKFQGQQAPIVIFSLAASTPEDAPRGMEFLYSANRFNVATSRARCACFLVASPRLFEPECQTPRQMRLANAFCRYLELATSVR